MRYLIVCCAALVLLSAAGCDKKKTVTTTTSTSKQDSFIINLSNVHIDTAVANSTGIDTAFVNAATFTGIWSISISATGNYHFDSSYADTITVQRVGADSIRFSEAKGQIHTFLYTNADTLYYEFSLADYQHYHSVYSLMAAHDSLSYDFYQYAGAGGAEFNATSHTFYGHRQ